AHDHVRPQIGLALQPGLAGAWPKPAVPLLAGQHRINPLARFLDDLLVLQHVPQVAIAFEPIGQFLPSVLAAALRVRPGTSLELAPFGYLLQVTRHAVCLEFELMPQPTFRSDAPDRQLDQWAGQQRLSVPGIEWVRRVCRRLWDYRHSGSIRGCRHR